MQALNLSRGIRPVLALAAFAAAAVASAGTLTSSFDSRTLNSMNQPVDLQTGQSGTYTLAGFNSSLGTLTSLTYSFSGDVFAAIDFDNPVGSGSQSFSNYINYGLKLKEHSTGTTLIDLSKNIVDSVGPLPAGATYHFDYSKSQTNPLVSVTVTDPMILALASSKPTFQFDLTSFDDSYSNFGGLNGNADYAGTMRVQGMVSYSYQPVPEPASMAALGLGALGVLRRRARKNAL